MVSAEEPYARNRTPVAPDPNRMQRIGNHERFCEECGRQLWGGRPDKRYCGGTCRNKAWRKRQPPKPVTMVGECLGIGCGHLVIPPRRKWCSESCRTNFTRKYAAVIAENVLNRA